MPPTLEKLKRHIASGLSVRASMRALKFCYHDISKTITAMSFKLGQHNE